MPLPRRIIEMARASCRCLQESAKTAAVFGRQMPRPDCCCRYLRLRTMFLTQPSMREVGPFFIMVQQRYPQGYLARLVFLRKFSIPHDVIHPLVRLPGFAGPPSAYCPNRSSMHSPPITTVKKLKRSFAKRGPWRIFGTKSRPNELAPNVFCSAGSRPAPRFQPTAHDPGACPNFHMRADPLVTTPRPAAWLSRGLAFSIARLIESICAASMTKRFTIDGSDAFGTAPHSLCAKSPAVQRIVPPPGSTPSPRRRLLAVLRRSSKTTSGDEPTPTWTLCFLRGNRLLMDGDIGGFKRVCRRTVTRCPASYEFKMRVNSKLRKSLVSMFSTTWSQGTTLFVGSPDIFRLPAPSQLRCKFPFPRPPGSSQPLHRSVAGSRKACSATHTSKTLISHWPQFGQGSTSSPLGDAVLAFMPNLTGVAGNVIGA